MRLSEIRTIDLAEVAFRQMHAMLKESNLIDTKYYKYPEFIKAMNNNEIRKKKI